MTKRKIFSNKESFLKFLNASSSAWHAVKEVKSILLQHHFEELLEEHDWKLKKNGNYFVCRNGSSILAFITPSQEVTSTLTLGAHTDSPSLKLKPHAEYVKENMMMLGVEMYGAPILSSWFNRDLGIAGRVLYTNSRGQVANALVKLDEYPVTLPQLAIHLDRKVNDEGFQIQKQEHLAAVAGLITKKEQCFLEALLKKKIPLKELLAHDLFLYPMEEAKTIGLDHHMIASARLDNLASAFAAVSALTTSTKPAANQMKMVALWDNEEIGSATAQGADSPFFLHVLERIFASLGQTRVQLLQSLSQSLCISIDMVHAFHPNFPDKHEPRHPVLMGEGCVLKYHAQKKYATDVRSSEYLLGIAKKNKIAIQYYTPRGDIPSGSTIGPIHTSITGIPTVDLGIPQLSMHSSRELMAWHDFEQICSLLNGCLTST